MDACRASSLLDTNADDGDSFTLAALERVDWTSLLPEPCRLLIVERMDSTTRAAWRGVNKQACQDVYAATKQLSWLRLSSEHGVQPLQVFKSPVMKANRRSSLLSKLPSLQHLRYIYVERLGGIGFRRVSSTLRSLHISGGIQDLSPLQHCLRLEELTLDGLYPYPKGLLADTLPAVTSALSPCLRSFHMSFLCGSAPERTVLQSVAFLTRLQQLSLYLPHLESGDWLELAPPLSCMTDLQLLNLSYNSIGSAMSALAPAIGQLQQLCTLRLDDCRLHSGDASALAQAIMPLPALMTQLGVDSKLTCNGNHAAGATTLIPAPQGPSATLVSLRLGCNDFGADGMAAFAPAIQRCTALTDLDLRDNILDGEGGTALRRALTVIAPSLTSLNLSGSNIGCHGAAALAPALGAMSALKNLRFGFNLLGTEGLRALAPALQSMPLLLLEIDVNTSDDEGAHLLVSIMEKMTTLRMLHVCECELGSKGKALIQGAAAQLPDLQLWFC